MYQDYKGFVHADLNGHSNGSGYFSLEDYAKSKLVNLNYSNFIGINIEISADSKFVIYCVVKDLDENIMKHELKGVDRDLFQEVFNGVSMMIYDKNVAPIEKLEEVYVLETIPIR